MARPSQMTEAIARQRLADVPQEKHFWCNDGQILKNLAQLEMALHQMTDITFRYHCNQEKCDFANWVSHVMGEEKLARDLLQSTTREQAANAVAGRVAYLKSKAAS